MAPGGRSVPIPSQDSAWLPHLRNGMEEDEEKEKEDHADFVEMRTEVQVGMIPYIGPWSSSNKP